MYYGFCYPFQPDRNLYARTRKIMKKFFLMALVSLILAGCSLSKAWNWMDKMDWERDDQTVKVEDFSMSQATFF
jgi:hypothetical protein